MRLIATILFAGVTCFSSLVSAAEFRLFSNDIKEGHIDEPQVLNTFGCKGENISPRLAWEGAPPGTKSFVVTMYDPDAPTGSGWWHWVVVDIPASAKELPRGSGSGKAELPKGALQTRTDFGKPGYGGPCPPPGNPHHYIFTIHALKVDRLEVDPEASAAMVGFMTNSNSLGKATFTATYKR
ncbi:MAG TPA: kinase inhibitor [Candidatus Manganitrophaceae bacterium]|nr:kinase inhibitor [Candidatus Manganitrophaceae bacterium]